MRNQHENHSLPNTPMILHYRCIELLQREAHRPLVALIAPTGYGKTSLLRAWTDSIASNIAVIWLTMDKEDNELRHLLARLILAFPVEYSNMREKMIEQLNEEDQAPLMSTPRALLETIIKALRSLGEIHLIIDRYEAIQETAVHDTFEYLITHSDMSVHYYIASQEKLPFYTNLHGIYPGPLTISYEHLKLNPIEIKQFVHRRTNQQLQAADLQRLDQITEGWPLAVERFASLLDGRRANSLSEYAAIDAINSEVQGIFLDNILLRQPEELQQFILRTSIPQFFDAELSLLLTECSSYNSHLELIMRKSLFLNQDKNGQYRYHPLFVHFLRNRLKQVDMNGYLSMHERVSTWSEKNGYLAEAVQHALHIPDYDQASMLLLKDIDSTISYPSQNLIQLLDQFPSMEISRRPSIAMFYAWLLTAEHRITAAETVLDQAEKLMTAETYLFTPTGEDLHGYIASIRSRIYLLRRDTDRGMTFLQEAASRLNGAGYLYSHANVLDSCGSSLLKSNIGYWGAIEQSIAIYGYAEPLWSGVNQGYGIIHAILGECYYEQNKLELAEKSLLIGRRIGLDLMNMGIILPASLTLIQLKWTRGEQQAAQILLEETKKLITKSLGERGLSVLDACQTRLNMKANQLNPVRKWLRNHPTDSDNVLDIRYMFEYLTLLRTYIYLGRFQQGVTFGERLLQFAQSWYLHYHVGETYLLLAMLYEGNGERNTAFNRLESALEIGQQEGYIQLFLNEWDIAEPLLNLFIKQIRAKKRNPSQNVVSFYKLLVHSRSEQAIIVDKDLFAQSQLTTREYKVLQCLIGGCSNTAIAEELSISIETVKSHCKNIYRKLHLESRKAILLHFAADDK